VLIDFWHWKKSTVIKVWDIAFDLQKLGTLLFNENHSLHIKKLEGQGIDDFLDLKKDLVLQIHG